MSSKPTFAGDLAFMGLPDIFQILSGNRASGTLKISSRHSPAPAMVYFSEGSPVDAAIGPLRAIDAIYPLFGWAEGKFEFHHAEMRRPRLVKAGSMQIILDGLRMVDDGLIRRVGPVPEQGSRDESECSKVDEIRVNRGPFVDYSYVVSEESFKDGRVILKEGSHGNWIWVILEGTVCIDKETPEGPVTVARLGEGCFIGTLLSLLHGENTRTATVTAEGPVHLGLLDTQRLSGEYASLTPDFRRFLLSLAGRLCKITDNTVDMFLKKYSDQSLTRDNRLFMAEGSSTGEIFSILEGKTYVVGKTPRGELPLLMLGKKDVFGFVPFLDFGHEPRRASVMASPDLKVSRLDAEKLQSEYEGISMTLRNLVHDLGTSVSVTTRLACHL